MLHQHLVQKAIREGSGDREQINEESLSSLSITEKEAIKKEIRMREKNKDLF